MKILISNISCILYIWFDSTKNIKIKIIIKTKIKNWYIIYGYI